MFKKKSKNFIETDFITIKNLKLFERLEIEGLDCNGLSIYYIRVPNGIIRCASNTEVINQVFIPLDKI